MKKAVSLLLAGVMCVGLLAGCSSSSTIRRRLCGRFRQHCSFVR